MTLFKRIKRFFNIFILIILYLRIGKKIEKKFGYMPLEKKQKFMQEWAKKILHTFRFKLEVIGLPETEKAILLVGNHVSYLDIPLVMSLIPTVFVAKREIGTWPIIGAACRRIGVVFVDRDSQASRKKTAYALAQCILERKENITIFPSGTTTLHEAKPWKRGTFYIAKEHNLWVQPFRLKYHPLRDIAFIEDDAFIFHLWNLLKYKVLEAKIEFHKPIKIKDVDKDCEHWWKWSQWKD